MSGDGIKVVRVGRISIKTEPRGTFIKLHNTIEPNKLSSLLSKLHLPKIDDILIKNINKHQGKWIKISDEPINSNGYFELITSSDGLIGRIIYYPAIGNGTDMTEDDIYNALINKHHVSPKYIDKSAVTMALQKPGIPQVVARGIPPIHGKNAYIKVIPEEKKVKPTLKKGKIDWHEITSLIYVNEGDIVIEKIPPTPGKPGRDIFDREISPIPGKDIELESIIGEGLKVDGNKVIATTSGILVKEEGKYKIEEVYIVDGDLDYEVGNIKNVKHVEVRGSVLPGFSIEAKGNVIVRGTLDNGYIKAGGNVYINGIATGDKEGYIKASGFVYAREFIEITVESGGSVYSTGGFRHSHIFSGENIIAVNPRAIAVGGSLMARKYIYVPVVGNIHGTRTEVHAGYIEDLKEELRAIKEQMEHCSISIEKIIDNLKNIRTPKTKQILMNNLNCARDSLRHFEEEKKKIEETMRKASSYAVYVAKEAHPGSVFKLAGWYTYKPREKLNMCVIRLVDGELKPDKWTKPPFKLKIPAVKIKKK